MPEQVITPGVRTGLSIPDYELLRPIGRGAYGEVWLARNVTGSWVALKVVHRAAFDHDRPFEREFEGIQRFEPISRSDPSQVAILHVGLGEGFFYYVMELADDAAERSNGAMESGSDGSPTRQQHSNTPSLQHSITPASYAPKTLKRLLNDRGALPAQECLTVALSLTRALAHLHGHGLVHRDVKPSNVIFVNGQAKLADIGLVTSVDATRSFVGTEGYLPPEGAGTPQADLYSLGKVLYEMSTGCDRKEFPALPSDIATRPDRHALAELNAIVVRACQLDPRERYASAEAMQADLELLQVGKSVNRKRAVQRRWAFTWKTSVAVAAVALATTVGWQLFYGIAFERLSAPILRPVIPREAKVIAVLPFDNESPDKSDDYLGKQMAEELSTALSRIPSLRVLGRDSAAALKTATDRRTVAQQRKLAAMIDGRVRKTGTQLHLAAQLINPADDSMLWSDDCDGEIGEFSALQTRLAEGVVKALTGKLSDTDRKRLAIKATRNPEAYQLYLEARSFCGDEGLPFPESWNLARVRFQSAIDLDQQFAAAYAGLADCFIAESPGHKSPKEVLQKAVAAAAKAVELDSTLAEAHTALAIAKYRLYDWEGAGKEFELAIRFGSNLVSAHIQYAKHLTSQGRFDEAIAHSRQAVELDPGSTALGISLGWILFDAHQYDQARKAFETVLEPTPNSDRALIGLGWCHFVKGQPAEAVARWTGQPQAFRNSAALLQAYRQAGMQGYWAKQLEQSLEQLKPGVDVDPFWLAADYAMAGDTAQAFECLERAYEQHRPSMPLVAVKNQFDNLHSDWRFAALLKKMGLKMPVWKP